MTDDSEEFTEGVTEDVNTPEPSEKKDAPNPFNMVGWKKKLAFGALAAAGIGAVAYYYFVVRAKPAAGGGDGIDLSGGGGGGSGGGGGGTGGGAGGGDAGTGGVDLPGIGEREKGIPVPSGLGWTPVDTSPSPFTGTVAGGYAGGSGGVGAGGTQVPSIPYNPSGSGSGSGGYGSGPNTSITLHSPRSEGWYE